MEETSRVPLASREDTRSLRWAGLIPAQSPWGAIEECLKSKTGGEHWGVIGEPLRSHWGAFGEPLGSQELLGSDCGAILQDFGRILEAFWEDFQSFLEGIGRANIH